MDSDNCCQGKQREKKNFFFGLRIMQCNTNDLTRLNLYLSIVYISYYSGIVNIYFNCKPCAFACNLFIFFLVISNIRLFLYTTMTCTHTNDSINCDHL